MANNKGKIRVWPSPAGSAWELFIMSTKSAAEQVEGSTGAGEKPGHHREEGLREEDHAVGCGGRDGIDVWGWWWRDQGGGCRRRRARDQSCIGRSMTTCECALHNSEGVLPSRCLSIYFY